MAKVKAQTPMQKQFADSYEEQRKEMFLHVARELTGRAKQRQLPKGKALDPTFRTRNCHNRKLRL